MPIKFLFTVAMCVTVTTLGTEEERPTSLKGFVDTDGKEVIPLQFQGAGEFSEGLVSVLIEGRWGFIDKMGQIAIQPQFNGADSFKEGLAIVKIEDKYGYVNKEGRIVADPIFTDAQSFNEGLARVELNGKVGFIDKQGEFIADLVYDDATTWFRNGLASVSINGKWGAINKKGNLVIAPQYSDCLKFRNGVARIDNLPIKNTNDFKTHYVNQQGKKVFELPDNYEFSWTPRSGVLPPHFSEGLCRIFIDDRYWGYMDTKGDLALRLDPNVSTVGEFSEGLTLFRRRGEWKYGFIDRSGSEIIPPKYSDVQPFFEGVAAVAISDRLLLMFETGTWGYIDKKGNWLVEPQYDHASRIREGHAVVRKDNRVYVINTAGEVKFEFKYHRIGLYHEGLARVERRMN